MTAFSQAMLERALIEIRADVKLKDTIVVAMPKLVGEGFYTCTIYVEYEWKPHRFWSCQVRSTNNIDSGVVKNLKKANQALRGVPVGSKVGFKPAKQVYRLVSKKTNANTSINKKKYVEPIKEIDRLIIDEKVTLVDDEGKPLNNVNSSGDHDSEDEVESIDIEMANFLASKKVGYGTNSLLEQWKETYENDDYEYDPYDDDLYEGHEEIVYLKLLILS
ncbi:hypothetical protein Tco_0286547 [Tanacetum coccineum]